MKASMKKGMMAMVLLLSAVTVNAKTLVAYYSYTNNVERIVNALRLQIACDVLEIEPAEKGLDYAANNYALGTQLLNAIKANPNDASSYPAIDKVTVNMNEYDMVIIACPLWWSQMAAPFQTFLFHYGPQMAGKKIGVIVSSASSGISGVVADAKRLIPDGDFVEPNLWSRSSQTTDAASLLETWLTDINYSDDEGEDPVEPVDPVEPAKYTLTAVANNADFGSVTGGGEYEAGETVTLTATAAEGYAFKQWSDEVTANPRTVTVMSDTIFTAIFKKIGDVGVDALGEVDFSLYPNPTNGHFMVETSEAARMEIYNAAGAQVLSAYVPAKRVVELQNAGLYFVKMTAANRTTVKRIIVR